MEEDYKSIKKRLKFLEGLRDLRASEVPNLDSKKLLNNDVNVVKSVPTPEIKTVVKGAKEVIENPKAIQKLTSGADFTDKIANLRALKSLAKTGGAGLKSVVGAIPYVGGALGIASALASGDVSAAAQEAGEELLPPPVQAFVSSLKSTDAGPQKGSLAHRLESGDKLTDEEYSELMKQGNR